MIFSLVRFGSVRFVHTVMLSSYAVMLVFPLKWDSLLFTRIDRIWPVCKRKRATDWERRERESGRMNVVTKWKKEMMVLNAQYIRWILYIANILALVRSFADTGKAPTCYSMWRILDLRRHKPIQQTERKDKQHDKQQNRKKNKMTQKYIRNVVNSCKQYVLQKFFFLFLLATLHSDFCFILDYFLFRCMCICIQFFFLLCSFRLLLFFPTIPCSPLIALRHT